MEKFKNLYGDSRRARKLGIKRLPLKPKTRKRKIEKSLVKYGDNLAEFLISTIDLAGQVPMQDRENSLLEVTQQVLNKMTKIPRKKRRSKLPLANSTEVVESSEEESFDEDNHLACAIKTKLIKAKAKTRKRRRNPRTEEKFDSDKELKNVLKQKMSNAVGLDSYSSEEIVEADELGIDIEHANDVDLDEQNNSSYSLEENEIPGKFVLLKAEEQADESDSKSLEYSLGSNEVVSPPESPLNEPVENAASDEEMNLEAEQKLSENDFAFGIDTPERKTEIYDNMDDYDPTPESIEDMLYDSVFEPTSSNNVNNKQQSVNINANILKDFPMLQNISIEAIKPTPMVNGTAEKEHVVQPPPPVAKPVEDVVEILSSDDEEEKPAEKQPEPALTNDNHVAEEVSDNIFNVKFYKAGSLHVVVVLRHPTRLYFWGKLIATALFGNVYVLGYNLQKSIPYSIYSPGGLGKLYFETIPNEETFNPILLFPRLEKTGMSAYDIEQIVTSVNVNDVVLHLQNNNSILTRFLEMFSTNSKLFPTSRRPSNDGDYKSTLQTLFYKQEECFNGLNISDSWYGLSSYIFTKEFTAKVFVCGGKSVGKSTLNRFLLNSHVYNTPIIYVDLDVGQPEFGISGTISATKVNGPVLGPSYTHTKTKFLKMHFVSELDVMDNLKLYLNSIKQMMEELWEDYSDLPWIINTMGFVKTFGESINVAIIRMVRPTFVIQIHDKDPKNNYQSYMRPELVYNYDHGLEVELPMQPSNFEHMLIMTETNTKKINLEPKQIRDLNVLSYFSNILTEDSIYLADIVPQMAQLSCLKIWNSNALAPDLIRNSLNAKLVALCQVDSDIPTKMQDGLQVITKDFEVGPVCLGFGIVRGINENEIFVLTPFRSNGLRDVNCIASCCQTLPTSLFTKYSPSATDHVSYVSLKRSRPVTSQIPKRNFHLQRSRASINGKQM